MAPKRSHSSAVVNKKLREDVVGFKLDDGIDIMMIAAQINFVKRLAKETALTSHERRLKTLQPGVVKAAANIIFNQTEEAKQRTEE